MCGDGCLNVLWLDGGTVLLDKTSSLPLSPMGYKQYLNGLKVVGFSSWLRTIWLSTILGLNIV